MDVECHLTVMPTALFVILEQICLDVGWEIIASQMTILAHLLAIYQRQLYVIQTAMYVIGEQDQMDAG